MYEKEEESESEMGQEILNLLRPRSLVILFIGGIFIFLAFSSFSQQEEDIVEEFHEITHRTFLDVDIDKQRLGRIVIGLYGEVVPKTVENFRALCTGEFGKGKSGKALHYKGIPFHRIIPGFMIQGGDTVYGNGRGNESIYGGVFCDENFKIKHSHAGMVAMVNSGPNSNGAQFFITTVKAYWLDGEHVVFGKVIEGMDTVYAIEGGAGTYSGKPRKKVVIADSGEILNSDDTTATGKSSDVSEPPSKPLLSSYIDEFNQLHHSPPPSESDPSSSSHYPTNITYNYQSPRPIKDIAFLILFLLFVILTFGFGIFASINKNPNSSSVSAFAYDISSDSCIKRHSSSGIGDKFLFLNLFRLNGEIVPREEQGKVFCVWKQDSWVPAYFALAIITMLWSATAMVEAQVYVISGTIAQWYFSKDDSKVRKTIRHSLRNAFGPSFGTICFSGLLIGIVRIVRAAVDSAASEDASGMINLILRCCVNAFLSAFEFLNKFTINFSAITGEAYCSSARLTYELLRRNLLSAVIVETVSTRLLAAIIFVLSAIYAIVVCVILKAASGLGVDSYFVAAMAFVVLMVVLGLLVSVLDNVIDTVYICYAVDRDKGEVCKQEVHEIYVHLPIKRNHNPAYLNATARTPLLV
ncbi:hypothetical protein LXL04_025327 [Taraxacum kok-saghyz]